MAERGAAAAGASSSGKDSKATALAEEMEEIKELIVMKDLEITQLKTSYANAEAKVKELMETKDKDDIMIEQVKA